MASPKRSRASARASDDVQDGALFSAQRRGAASRRVEHAKLPPRLRTRSLRCASPWRPAADAGAKMPSELGDAQGAAIARALALEPEVLFLDEPTSGLDPITARAFDGLLRVLCDDLGLTVIVVTHDLDTLLGIVDRVIVLARGKVLADAPVREVIAIDDDWVQSYFSVRRMINTDGEVEDGV
jgi:phospholipid/cholesterol/gamma-HCH transport system ATP-binding protein